MWSQKVYGITVPFTSSLEHFHWYTGADLDTLCPPGSQIQHAPFQLYFSFPYFASNVQNCWGYAECVFLRLEDVRKQQWGATALVIGVLPITLFINVVWPRKRFVHVTTRLPLLMEAVIRALGLDVNESGHLGAEENSAVRLWNMAMRTSDSESGVRSLSMFAISLMVLLGTYTALTLVEVHSKRSLIRCPYPIYILSWYLIALIPGLLHTLFCKYQQPSGPSYTPIPTITQPSKANASTIVAAWQDARASASYDELEGRHQQARDWWPIQLSWNIYFVIGILVYSSIMVVTVLELAVWVFTSCLTVLASKVHGFLLIALHEDRASIPRP